MKIVGCGVRFHVHVYNEWKLDALLMKESAMAAVKKPASRLMTGNSISIVLVTAPPKLADSLARKLLEERLIACANLLPHVTSLYRWQGKVQRGKEVLLVMKTDRRRLKRLHKRVRELHSYVVPEFLVVTIAAADSGYAAWVSGASRI
jgi:periplasmic divalent cation tolerance protein